MRRSKKVQNEEWSAADIRRMKALLAEAQRVYRKAQAVLDALQTKKTMEMISKHS